MPRPKWSFPKEVFIRRNTDRPREPFLEIEDDPEQFALPSETVLVAEYKLVGVRKITCKIEIK